MPARTLVIGLDACEQALLLEWARAGVLPTFRRLLDNAAWGITEAPVGVYAGAVWPSFNTGTNPSRHRRFFRRQAARGEYLDADFTPLDIVGTPFWEHLSAAGKRVAVLDVPHSKLAASLNGVQVVDWATHEPELDQALTYPEGLRAEIVERFGMQPPDLCEQVSQTVEGYRTLYSHLETRLRNKVALSRHCLQSSDWDLLITVFGEAHCAGHQWWHLHDTSHPRHDAAIAAQTGDLLQKTYIDIDRAVGELLAAADPETRVVVVASHGMGPLHTESVVLDEILRRLESRATASRRSLFGTLKQGWYSLPAGLRSSLPVRLLKSRLQRSLHQSLLSPERRRRRFFAIPHNPHAGAIRINLIGRESHGVVNPGDEYHAVCDDLRRELLRLTCPQTGAPVVDEVYTAGEIYHGPFVDELPDLLVEWRRDKPANSITSPSIGTVEIPSLGGRTGDHTRHGIFFATGPGITAGRVTRNVPIIDFAPTFCTRLGISPSPAFDGNAISELLADAPGPRTPHSSDRLPRSTDS